MTAARPSTSTDWVVCLERSREILQTSKLSVDILLEPLVSNDVVTTEEAANVKQLSVVAPAREKIDSILDLLVLKEFSASEIFFQTIKVHEPWIIDRLQLEGIPVSQFLECDDLTSEVDKLKVTESETSDNTAPPRPQTVSELEQEENWDKLPQLWFRATELQFGEGVPVVPLVQVFFDSIFPEVTNDLVAKYVKQSVHTDGRLTVERQFGTYENFVNETRGAVGIVTMKKLPEAQESEAIIQIYECFRS
ncbi:uncharacterized protein LOC106168172 [Lingula anatina]|uniref:Uncharacterized protein LOC106168172 n=1 Tax=Lingula anatina TaxID=7574 RepID=A0A1S3IYG2_LINAN|nr:uncharacterized protein LOC106168172 [Lingula anatina]|eukprot:XP_013402584.1 uncharacterized protein LOC106168172 [Lingula anatina]